MHTQYNPSQTNIQIQLCSLELAELEKINTILSKAEKLEPALHQFAEKLRQKIKAYRQSLDESILTHSNDKYQDEKKSGAFKAICALRQILAEELIDLAKLTEASSPNIMKKIETQFTKDFTLNWDFIVRNNDAFKKIKRITTNVKADYLRAKKMNASSLTKVILQPQKDVNKEFLKKYNNEFLQESVNLTSLLSLAAVNIEELYLFYHATMAKTELAELEKLQKALANFSAPENNVDKNVKECWDKLKKIRTDINISLRKYQEVFSTLDKRLEEAEDNASKRIILKEICEARAKMLQHFSELTPLGGQIAKLNVIPLSKDLEKLMSNPHSKTEEIRSFESSKLTKQANRILKDARLDLSQAKNFDHTKLQSLLRQNQMALDFVKVDAYCKDLSEQSGNLRSLLTFAFDNHGERFNQFYKTASPEYLRKRLVEETRNEMIGTNLSETQGTEANALTSKQLQEFEKQVSEEEIKGRFRSYSNSQVGMGLYCTDKTIINPREPVLAKLNEHQIKKSKEMKNKLEEKEKGILEALFLICNTVHSNYYCQYKKNGIALPKTERDMAESVLNGSFFKNRKEYQNLEKKKAELETEKTEITKSLIELGKQAAKLITQLPDHIQKDLPTYIDLTRPIQGNEFDNIRDAIKLLMLTSEEFRLARASVSSENEPKTINRP